jgi:serine/threonine protein phosphatase PrpC
MPETGSLNSSLPGVASSYDEEYRRPADVFVRASGRTRAPSLIDPAWRPWAAVGVLLCCGLPLSATPLSGWGYRSLLAFLVVGAAALSGGSVWSARGSRRAQRFGAGESEQGVPSARGGGGLVVQLPRDDVTGRQGGSRDLAQVAPVVERVRDPASGQGQRTGVSAATDPSTDRPLRIGKGSKAHGSVWRLPARPVQSGVAADGAQLGDLAVRAASIVGAGHRLDDPGIARQDAYRIARDVSGDHLVVAVADGVSSGDYSDIGAAAAVVKSVSHLCHQLADQAARGRGLDFRAAFEQAATQVLETARQRHLTSRDVATVLMTCAIPTYSHDLSGSRPAWFAWVGDLSAWILREGEWSHVAGDRKQDIGGIISNAVAHALPDSPNVVRIGHVAVWPGDVLLVASDGVGDAMELYPQLQEYLGTQWDRPPTIGDYLADLEFEAPQCLDDRTGVAIWVGAATGDGA